MVETPRLTIQDCKNWLAQGSDTEEGRIMDGIVKQLLDTMQREAGLREALHRIANGDDDPMDIAHIAIDHEYPSE